MPLFPGQVGRIALVKKHWCKDELVTCWLGYSELVMDCLKGGEPMHRSGATWKRSELSPEYIALKRFSKRGWRSLQKTLKEEGVWSFLRPGSGLSRPCCSGCREACLHSHR